MSTFDEREKGYESKFARDEELDFKITARRNKLLGLWAAEKLGKKAADADQYAKDVILADFEVPGDSDVIAKLMKDFKQAKIPVTEKDIEAEITRFANLAKKQVMEDKK